MTVEHLVWFKLREEIAAERHNEHIAGLKSLRETVPGIVRLEVGLDFSGRSAGFQLGLLVTLADRAALDAYQVHPAHVTVAQALRADCSEIRALDFEPA